MAKELNNLLYIIFAVLILLLSIFNLQKLKRKEIVTVLGTETNNLFWEDLVAKHPTYIDGWVELGRFDKVSEIDPNYFQEP